VVFQAHPYGAMFFVPLQQSKIAMVLYRWPIEIDGLPFLNMGGFFHGKPLNNQRVNPPCIVHFLLWMEDMICILHHQKDG